jgi:hypothetical protein
VIARTLVASLQTWRPPYEDSAKPHRTHFDQSRLVLTVAQQLRPTFALSEAPVLRARALEIIDGQGRVRASINVLPSSKSPNGEDQAETVLLRLITERGRPSVKIGASEPTSGLSFAGPTGTKDTYVILQSKGTTSSLKLRNEDGREQVLSP